ncbi:SPOR domain-containing protein [Rhodobacter sp. SY28-1]|uniref:SPOR domain-containing protein n=1 Tax=Rhodobacter sp. SY28-1 TaxID=2562317 RepID=UPI001F0D46CE|nr:SPOR domain-containing protein [Rhodobacter sp. SY28-1]
MQRWINRLAKQGQQMADADYDFGGGYSHDEAAPRRGVRDIQSAAKVQRTINLAGALTSVALVVGFGIWGYKLAVRDVNGVPVIQAMEGPMRIAPADPGGEIADHQGLAVNDVAEAGVATPPPEKLILAPRPMELAAEDTSGLAGPMQPGLTEASAPTGMLVPGADLALAAAPPTESADPTEVAIDAALAEALGEIPDAALVVPVADPAVEMIEEPAPEGAILASIRPKARPGARAETAAPAEMATLPAANEIDPATITPGTRLVQFGTYDTADEARAAWAVLQGRFGELMTEKAMVVQPAESGGRTFYRLRAHGFDGEDDARRFCSAIIAEHPTCIPVPHK